MINICPNLTPLISSFITIYTGHIINEATGNQKGTGFTSDFLSFIDVELIWFFHGAF